MHSRPPETFSPLVHSCFSIDARNCGDAEDAGNSSSVCQEVARRLARSRDDSTQPGFALVTNVYVSETVAETRAWHHRLFEGVWAVLEALGMRAATGTCYSSTARDGSVEQSRYGSRWTYKRPHMDRNALIFSHLYGPVAGFEGGEVLILDARRYLNLERVSFREAFEWSSEPTGGSKPVLRETHLQRAIGEYGVNLGHLNQHQILFVNNTPESGILHGATPLRVTESALFVREIHRCAISGSLR